MISYCAEKLAITITRNMDYERNDVLWLGYALEVIISSVISVGIIAIGACIFHKIPYAILYLILLVPFRKYSGGYHANTHLNCIILTSGLFYLALLFTELINQIPVYMIIAEYILGGLTILKICPVSSPNKIVDENDKPKYKRISLIILTLESLLCLAFSHLNATTSKFCFIIILFVLLAAFAGTLIPLSDGEN